MCGLCLIKKMGRIDRSGIIMVANHRWAERKNKPFRNFGEQDVTTGGVEMKLKFSLKKQEVDLEANIEKLIEKGMDQKAKNPDRKTRYQIRQEEKRKTAELKHKQETQCMLIGAGILLGVMVIAIVMGVLASFGVLS